ncbi:MAG TPA: ATPase domain-containing protein [Candidatus Binataceae bacterium]|nr:ATPase domain-containing protein [Candidatus Binataceae bacterium]
MARSHLERITSGIDGLDEVLQGGFIKGGLYIIEGAPGTGKTILANQICFHHAKARKSVLYVTLIAETVGRMLLNIGSMLFFDETAVGAGIFYISGFNALKNEGLTGLLHLLRREVAARDAAILMIDGFASASDSAHSPEELKVFVQQLQTQADAADCTVFLLTNPIETKPSSEETMVDGIINLASVVRNYSAMRELHVRKFRGSFHLEGIHNYHIGQAGITVYPRIETQVRHLPSDNGHVRRVSSGITRLDSMIGGGIPERTMTMLVGPSGTGKTTAGLQFLAQASSDEPGLLFSFYETPARIRIKAQMFPPFVEALDAGHIEIMWQPPSEWLLDELAVHLFEAVRRRGVRRLLLDGLAGFKKALRSRPMEPFFSALVEELCRLGVTSICTAEAAEIIGPTITTPLGGLSDVTDNHILLRFIEIGARLYRIMSILKVRDSSFDSNLREFSITDHGIEIANDSASAELVLASTRRTRPPELTVSENK